MRNIRKFITKFIALALSLITVLVFSFACSCNGEEEVPENSNTEKTFTDIDLVKDGETNYKIVVSETATNYETYAAEELALYLKESTNCDFETVTDNGMAFNESDKVISLGQTKILEGSGVIVDYSTLKRDGFVIKRLGNTLVLCGGGGYGTLYAVYEFLYQQVDWEAYAVNEIYYVKTLNLKLVDFDFTDKPAIEHRHGGWYASQFDPYFSAKWRTYAGQGGMLFNEDVWFYFPHAIFRMVPPNEYADDHPDWYSDGEKQPCFTNEEFKAQLVTNLKALVLENPSVVFFPFGLEDTSGTMCRCQNCLDEISMYKESGLVVRWTNDVVEEMMNWKEEIGLERELYFPYLAYYDTVHAPVNSNGDPIDESCILNEYSPLIFADIHAANDQPYTGSQNAGTLNTYKNWMKCSKSNMAYHYTGSFERVFEWVDTVYAHTENYKLAAEFNAMYLLDDASNSTYQSMAFQQMYGYVYAKLKWNPNVDTNKLINDYITHYYKDAAEDVRSYYYLMKMQCNQALDTYVENGGSWSFVTSSEGIYLNKGVLEQGLALLKDGVKKIEESDSYTQAEKEIYIQRVEAEMLTPLCYILQRFRGNYTAQGYLERLEEMEALTSKYGITSITASGANRIPIEDVYEEWREKANVA